MSNDVSNATTRTDSYTSSILTSEPSSTADSTVASPQDSYHPPKPEGHSYRTVNITGGHAQLGDVYNFYYADDGAPTSRQHPSRKSTRIFHVPRNSSTYFTGRRLQLQQLEANLASSAGTSENPEARKIVVVHGLGGSGKTQYCLRYAEENQDR